MLPKHIQLNQIWFTRDYHTYFSRTQENNFKVVGYWKKQNLEKVVISDVKIMKKTTYLKKSVRSFGQTLVLLLIEINIIPYELFCSFGNPVFYGKWNLKVFQLEWAFSMVQMLKPTTF